MSKKEKVAPQATEEKKVVTKYDLKVRRRAEAAKKQKKEEIRGKIIGVVIFVALAAFILSFPIRRYLEVNGAYITVGEEKVSKVEFDYYYAMAKYSYLDTYANYISMLGIDTTTIDSEMYDDKLTLGQYFEQLAVQNITNTKSLVNAAEAEGFEYDTSVDYDEFIANLSAEAATAGVTLKEYIKSTFGSLLSEARLEEIVKETLYAAAFYDKKAEEKTPTQDAIAAYYEENKDNYDSVDYHMMTIEAELPTNTVEVSKPAEEGDTTEEYVPTEEEVAAAMEEAKARAEEAQKTVAAEGEAYTNKLKSGINSNIRNWLFDESRKEGDTSVIEDPINNAYFVVSFDKRYRDEVPTADIRVIMTTETDSQVILTEWENGARTEDSFMELIGKYDTVGASAYGGLYEGVSAAVLPAEMTDWIRDSARKAGDTIAVNGEDGTNYVCYYITANKPAWENTIRETMVNQAMTDYLAELAAGYGVKEVRAELAYLHLNDAAAGAEGTTVNE